MTTKLELNEEQLMNFTLAEIEEFQYRNDFSLSEIECVSMPDSVVIDNFMNNLILEEMSYNVDDMIEQHNRLYLYLTDEQRTVYNIIKDAVDFGSGGVFFLCGYGWKYILWNTLCFE